MNEITSEAKEVEVVCPNCGILKKLSYDAAEKRPVLYGECSFCKILWKWTKCNTVEVIPADRIYYIKLKQ